jgi:hypothetical protein
VAPGDSMRPGSAAEAARGGNLPLALLTGVVDACTKCAPAEPAMSGLVGLGAICSPPDVVRVAPISIGGATLTRDRVFVSMLSSKVPFWTPGTAAAESAERIPDPRQPAALLSRTPPRHGLCRGPDAGEPAACHDLPQEVVLSPTNPHCAHRVRHSSARNCGATLVSAESNRPGYQNPRRARSRQLPHLGFPGGAGCRGPMPKPAAKSLGR